MAEAVAIGGDSGFSIGRVASRTFGVVGRNFLPFFALALLATAPQMLFTAATARLAAPGPAAALFSGTAALTFVGTWLLAVVLSFVLRAALVHGTVVDLNGRHVSFGDALLTGLRQLGPLIVIGILYSIGIGLGFVLLIVPGLMLLTAWSVVVPARVIERIGIVDAFSRSSELTKGHRWPIFGLIVVYYLAVSILEFVARPMFGLSLLAQVNTLPVGYYIFETIFRAAVAVIAATGVACIYYELRSAKEGLGPEQLASVFD